MNWFLRSVQVVLAYTLLASAVSAEKPNIVVILTDDQGWGDLSLNGNTNLSTPNIDSLAKEGASFDRFYVCPVCSPTRAEFLTGRYHPRCGVYSTSAGGERINLDEVTIAESFKAAGYKTAAFGKWHNGMQFPYHPNGRGFDEFYGFCSGHWGNYFSPPLEHNGQIVQGEGFVIDDFTNKAMDFIEQHKADPFFVYLPYNTPHSPMQVPDRWWEKFKDFELTMRNRDPEKERIPHTRAALAMCENIDWNVGRLLGKLEELQIAENTIVVYFCDNGPNGARWNGDMKGRKGSTDEGGVRSPCLVRWPTKIKPGTRVEQIAGAVDLHPTLTKLAGISAKSKKPLDGIDVSASILTGKLCSPNRHIVSHWKNRVSIRTQKFRLDNNGRLFDLTSDPGQRDNIANKHPQQTKRMQQIADEFRAELPSNPGNDQRPFIVGHPDTVWTQLPARDATTKGNLKRSNKFPNCSYFSNWTSTDDEIWWDIELPADGTFEVEVHYTCAAKDVGSAIELRFGESILRAKVTEAHDPPAFGGNEDRTPRVESYVKNFRPLKLGTIRLKKSGGKLLLVATEIPGSNVMDFRLLMLKRVGE